MKKPSTKKLSKVKQIASVDRDRKVYTPLFEDEEFYQIPEYPTVYVSQYHRFITVSKNGKTLLRKVYYNKETGYSTIVLTNKNGRACKASHEWVAMVWCKLPTFLNGQDDIKPEHKVIEIHHIIKVKKNIDNQPIEVNFAENLFPVYKYYHPAIEKIRSIKILTKDFKWLKCDIRMFDYIAEYYDIPLKAIYDLIAGKPTYTQSGNEYFELSKEKVIVVSKHKKRKSK